ncbi:MAG: TetR/AcrR family transcriptional regulator [Alphaproteobacteria bacterium]|nr:TetR/AcrR family transcriptional regulator [Alphaproteobacteria bacterium]MBU1515354.1 TetR/AcrR family transcriptional regulator [Alphaproteobacteria bacterium]MBU2095404.1 TetR/AcrR family transcriptional regulator [Alphaproteobacteria bacterium]MBU2152576.1 TetR/AcrR family transcriptional regulator [Alphaproteobacteria bacterium]MBU2309972.1 TetR/AcrR family transcriptional regulator [Alphaproteobacteria bacterium]
MAEKRKTAVGRSHAERRREAETRILQAALKIIAKRGVDQLTLAEAGEAAGYSRALPAHYFGSRDDLLAAVAAHVVETYRQRLRTDERREGPRGLEALLEGVAFYIEDSRKSPTRLRGFYEVLYAGLRHASIAPSIAKLNQDSAGSFARNIRAAQERGEVRADLDPETEGEIVIAALRGLMTQWLIAPDAVDLDKTRDALVAGLRRNWAKV